ncbi:hypothetical protein ACS0TY_006667 [Phlomoides rotata]
MNVHVSRDDDSRVCGSSVSGQLTSRLAYDLLRASHPRVDSESLDHIFAHCPFTRNLLGKATSFHFGKQLRCLWRVAFITTLWSIWHSRNRAIFDEVQPSIHYSLAFILASIKEAGQSVRGHMAGTVRELLILDRLNIRGRSPLVQNTIVIRWKPPLAVWTKVNVDGSAPSSPGSIFAGAIFRNSRGFFVAAFAKAVGWDYPLEAELASILHAILFAFDRGWNSLWVEFDSILAIQTLQRTVQFVPWRLQGL